jgi:hypothetical protein
MAKQTLNAVTPAGNFSRETNTPYQFVVVWNTPRAAAAAAEIASNPKAYKSGVNGRWAKDRGFGVTWHGSEHAAQNAARGGYVWDGAATLVGIFPVAAD